MNPKLLLTILLAVMPTAVVKLLWKSKFHKTALLLVFLLTFVSVGGVGSAVGNLDFNPPTPANNVWLKQSYSEVNTTIVSNNLSNIILNWKGINYSIYDNNLIFAFNLDNNSNIGDTSSNIVNIANGKTNGTLLNRTLSICSGTNNCPVYTNALFQKGILFDVNGTINTSLNYNIHSVNGSMFTVIVLPDEHITANNASLYTNQTYWISNNTATLNIKFVMQTGDNVYGTEQGNDTQLSRANQSLSVLDGVVPYLIMPGNHDYDDVTTRDLTTFNKYFNYTKYSGYSWYGGHNGTNIYGLFSSDNNDFIVMGLEFCPTDSSLIWLNNTLTTFSNRSAIIFTHSYLDLNGNPTNSTNAYSCDSYGLGTPNGNEGIDIYNKVIQYHSNVNMVFSGHQISNPGTSSAIKITNWIDGNPVNQILANYQMLDSSGNGGAGYLRYYEIVPSTDKIATYTYSPYLNTFNATTNHQFNLTFKKYGFTIAAWVKPNVVSFSPTGMDILSTDKAGYNDDVLFGLVPEDTSITTDKRFGITMQDKEKAVRTIAVDTDDAIIGNWYYVVTTSDGNNISLYINGILKDTRVKNGNFLMFGSSGETWIGASPNSFRGWNGTIDEVRMWNRTLSAQEISLNYLLNIQKYNSTEWRVYKNVTQEGKYNYQVFANDTDGNSNISESRIFWQYLSTSMFNITQGALARFYSTLGLLIDDSVPVQITSSTPTSITFNSSQNYTGTNWQISVLGDYTGKGPLYWKGHNDAASTLIPAANISFNGTYTRFDLHNIDVGAASNSNVISTCPSGSTGTVTLTRGINYTISDSTGKITWLTNVSSVTTDWYASYTTVQENTPMNRILLSSMTTIILGIIVIMLALKIKM